MTLPFLSLADAALVFTVAMPHGAVVPVYAAGGPAGAPVLLFGHANGMAAGSYGPWLRMLAARVRVFAFDARGHGGAIAAEGPIEEIYTVDRMADDLVHLSAAVARRAGVARIAYAGHSLGGAAALRLLALGRAPDWTQCFIFEPPIFPPPGTRIHAEAVENQTRLVAGTLKRRVQWPSPEAFAARLKGRGMFARCDDALPHARLVQIPGAGHLIIAEQPARCAALVFERLGL
jgi:pimeloyl-ACP methyl ester carboxylesterase